MMGARSVVRKEYVPQLMGGVLRLRGLGENDK